MDLFIVVVRTLFFYAFILVIYRIMGKREIGQLSIQDLVVSILIAELVAISIENVEDPLVLTVVPISILVVLEVVSSMITLRNNKVRNVVEGKPALIIDKGKVNFKELIKQRYTLDDLLMELRLQGIKSLLDVEYAVLENSGKLSIFKYNFLRLDSDTPFPLILDGIIQNDTLEYLKKDNSWLNQMIEKENVNVKDIFYAFYKNKKLYVIKRSELKTE
ncbi:MAG: DUF421 domain-containing protein [Bacilli bacterium]|nr:DUF421 domain-containing protein [Bacilli bacterium]